MVKLEIDLTSDTKEDIIDRLADLMLMVEKTNQPWLEVKTKDISLYFAENFPTEV